MMWRHSTTSCCASQQPYQMSIFAVHAGHHATPHTDMADTVSLIHNAFLSLRAAVLCSVHGLFCTKRRHLVASPVYRHCISFSFAFTTRSKLTTIKAKITKTHVPTQPSIHPGSVNEYQLRLGRQRQVWFIPIS